ncbi:MAG TPA: 3-oxoacyl-[acyl-carrier-protein] synthase III C-terminal domain-containing protein [Candidatus Limnocylindria bacterium]|nr:3-oxoacyl-[acyl-carrier-protein] synthase III C-terminal domain-containing protein [Candidatus Limnocylindria bacterium]
MSAFRMYGLPDRILWDKGALGSAGEEYAGLDVWLLRGWSDCAHVPRDLDSWLPIYSFVHGSAGVPLPAEHARFRPKRCLLEYAPGAAVRRVMRRAGSVAGGPGFTSTGRGKPEAPALGKLARPLHVSSVPQMFIRGVGTAVPATRYKQSECWAVLEDSEVFTRLAPRSRALLRKVFSGQNGIDSRALALSPLTEAFDLTPNALHARFANNAPVLAAQAAERALKNANISRDEIDAVLISTCTGYLCPGLTSYVSERLGLRPGVFGLDLVGQGCVAAMPNLRTAEALIASRRARTALSICVEVCSAALYFDDDPGVLISACLFGDGAGAAVLSHERGATLRTIEWKDSESLLSPSDRDALKFETRDGMLRNILTTPVPGIAARHSAEVLERVLQRHQLKPEQITGWIWHSGGRDVLTALREQFGFHNGELDHTTAVLREYGNISSACVYHVLERSLANGTPPGWWWMSAFGAGFSCHGALLKVS